MTGEQCRAAASAWIGRASSWRRRRMFPFGLLRPEDGKATPDFLAAYEVDLRAALESVGVLRKAR